MLHSNPNQTSIGALHLVKNKKKYDVTDGLMTLLFIGFMENCHFLLLCSISGPSFLPLLVLVLELWQVKNLFRTLPSI